MSQKAWNLCFRHLNPKHKLRRRIRPQTPAPTSWSEAHRPGHREPPAGELPARTVFFPKPYKESEILSAIRKFAA